MQYVEYPTVTRRDNLNEISVMRPVLIILLVVYHAFIVYGGGWEKPSRYVDIGAYENIAKWSYSFLLEAFVFMSGYVFAFQIKEKGRYRSIKELVDKKVRRLIVPCLFWAVLYVLLIGDSITFRQFAFQGGGVGHLWFLPMLFWCFIFGWFVLRLRVPEKWKLLLLFMVALVSYVPLPFRLPEAMYYLFPFYMGVMVFNRFEQIQNWISFPRCILLWGVFIALFVLLTDILGRLPDSGTASLSAKVGILSTKKLLQCVYSSAGVLAFFSSAVQFSKAHQVRRSFVRLGGLCFGVYIFQQFILKALYFHTDVPALVGPYLLPWAGFAVALSLSLLVSWLISITRFGRYLI